MIIVGSAVDEEEAKEITYIAKIVLIGQRARMLGGRAKRKSLNSKKNNI